MFSLLRKGTVGPSEGSIQTVACSVHTLFCPGPSTVGGSLQVPSRSSRRRPAGIPNPSKQRFVLVVGHAGDAVSPASSSTAKWGLQSSVHDIALIPFMKRRSPECRSARDAP